jgi:hypothetical protein
MLDALRPASIAFQFGLASNEEVAKALRETAEAARRGHADGWKRRPDGPERQRHLRGGEQRKKA